MNYEKISTAELAIHQLLAAVENLLVLGGERERELCASAHAFILREWDERLAGAGAKILEILIEGIE